MGVSFLIVDGYNLMHAVGLARARYGPGQLQKQRERLLAFLAEHVSAIQRLRTTVVFDARDAPPGLARHAVHAEMEIVFARPGDEADPLIEELIAAHSAPKQVLLVSSDHRLQKAARRRRARFIDSEAFAEKLERAAAARDHPVVREPENPAEKTGGGLAAEDVAAWLEEFGPLPEAEGLSPSVDPNEVEFWRERLRELDEED